MKSLSRNNSNEKRRRDSDNSSQNGGTVIRINEGLIKNQRIQMNQLILRNLIQVIIVYQELKIFQIYKIQESLIYQKMQYLNQMEYDLFQELQQKKQESLRNLEILNLNGNSISQLPVDILKQLQKLRVLKLTRNKIKEFKEVQNLSALTNLESLSISENPFCKSITYQEFCLYIITGLKVLDSKKVDEDQKKNAQLLFSTNFSKKNINEVQQINSRDDIVLVKKQIEQSNKQKEQVEFENQYLKEERNSLNEQIENLNERFQQKLKENTLCVEKLSKLEAELQSYKIDAMFESFKDTKNFDLNKLMDLQNTQNLSEFDNQYYNKLEQRYKEIEDKREEYQFKISNLENQCQRLKERIIEREKEMNQAAENYFQMKNQLRMNTNIKFMKDSFMPDSDDLEILIKQKEQKLAYHYNESEKLRYTNSDMQRDIDQTREKIDKTRILINRLDAINEGESTCSEIEDERIILDKKINSLYQKLTTQQEKNNEIIHLITQINNEVAYLSQEIEDLKKQRQESYLKSQKTVKTNESESIGVDNNEKLKDLSNNITFFQNEINLMNEKLEENQRLLKEFHILLSKNQNEKDILESQKQQQQNNFKASTFVNNLSNSFKKSVQNQLLNTANNLQNLIHIVKTKAPKILNKKISLLNRVEQQILQVSQEPQIDNISQCIADLGGALRYIFEEMDDYKIEQGVIFDEKTNQKRKEFQQLQQQIEDYNEEKQKCFEQVNSLYKEYLFDQMNAMNKKRRSSTNAQQDDIYIPEKFESFEDMQSIFSMISKMLKNVEKNELSIKNFNEVKSKFLDEFEKETQDLSQKWREFESRKAEHKSKINNEREQLYKQIEQEYEKIKIERENLKLDRQNYFEEQEKFQNYLQKHKQRDDDEKQNMDKNIEETRETKQNLEMELYQLKAHLTRLQNTADETEAKKNIAEKDLQRLMSQIQKESEKVLNQHESKDKHQKIQFVFEENIKQLQNDNEQLQIVNEQLQNQKQVLVSEIQRFEVDIKLMLDKFGAEEATYKQKLKELDNTIQEKRKSLYQTEQHLSEKEINMNRIDSLLEEYNSTKEKHKETKKESLLLEKQIEDSKIKIDENEMKIKMQQNQLSSLKKHLDSLSSLSKQKQSEVLHFEKQYSEIQQSLLEAELKIQKLEGQQSYLIEEMNKIEKQRGERRKDLQNLEKQFHDKDLDFQNISSKYDHIKAEYESKQRDLLEIRTTYQQDEKKFKQLMEENHKTLQQLRENIEEREQTYYNLNRKRENLENTEKSKQDTLQNIIKQIYEKENQLQMINQQIQNESVEQNHISKRLQELSNIQSQLIEQNGQLEEKRQELNEQVNDLEQYSEELKDEQKEILERIKVLQQKEDTIYANMALNGDELDENIQNKIESIIQSYYANSNKDESIEQLKKEIQSLQLENDNFKNILNEKNRQLIVNSQQKSHFISNYNSGGKLAASSSQKNNVVQKERPPYNYRGNNEDQQVTQDQSKFQLDTFAATKNDFIGLNTLTNNNLMMIHNDNESLLLSSDNKQYQNLALTLSQKNNQDIVQNLHKQRQLQQIDVEKQNNPFLKKFNQLDAESTPPKIPEYENQDNHLFEDNLFSSDQGQSVSSKVHQNNQYSQNKSIPDQQQRDRIHRGLSGRNQDQNQYQNYQGREDNNYNNNSNFKQNKQQQSVDKIFQDLEEADRELIELEQKQLDHNILMDSSSSSNQNQQNSLRGNEQIFGDQHEENFNEDNDDQFQGDQQDIYDEQNEFEN